MMVSIINSLTAFLRLYVNFKSYWIYHCFDKPDPLVIKIIIQKQIKLWVAIINTVSIH